MTRKILILAVLIAATFFALPTDAAAQRRNRSWDRGNESSRLWQQDDNGRRRRRFKGRNRYTYGYKNYGQYRRTQVGNRRYRTVRRYYWNDGVRLSRLVRLYY